jgi:hypothetical protein
MKKIIFIIMLLFVSCTTTTVPKASMYTKDEIVDIGIKEVKRTHGLDIDRKDTAVMKSGYGLWKVVIYSATNPIFVLIDENGTVKSVEVKDYIY